jgi:hypothetical protein
MEGLANLTFSEVDLRDSSSLLTIKPGSWDVIFTWAVLIYIPPKSSVNLLSFCVSSAKRLIFIEQHRKMIFFIKGRLIRNNPTWIRDYIKLFRLLNLNDSWMTVSSVPNYIWHPGGGHGAQIDIQICKNE